MYFSLVPVQGQLMWKWLFMRNAETTLEACERDGITFNPLPVETLCGWHKKAVYQLRKIAKAQSRSNGKEDDAIRHLFQR